MRFKNPQRPAASSGGGTQLSDQFLQIRVNGDLALFQALGRNAARRRGRRARTRARPRLHRRRTPRASTSTSPHLRRAVTGTTCSSRPACGSGEIEELADRLRRLERIIVCWAMGLTQHKNAVATIREIVNLLLLARQHRSARCGVCPVRGHSNVQGDRTMGIWEQPSAAFLDALA